MGSYRTIVEQLIHQLVSLYLQFRSIASKDIKESIYFHSKLIRKTIMSYILTTLFTVAAVCQGFHLPNLVGEEDCISINNSPGQCIQITNCQKMATMLESQNSKEKVQFLTEFSCGFTNNVPNICCPLDQTVLGRAAVTSPPSTTSSTTSSSTTTTSFRLIEETTSTNKKIRSRGSDNDLRIGFNEWDVKCTSEFCDEAFGRN